MGPGEVCSVLQDKDTGDELWIVNAEHASEEFAQYANQLLRHLETYPMPPQGEG